MWSIFVVVAHLPYYASKDFWKIWNRRYYYGAREVVSHVSIEHGNRYHLDTNQVLCSANHVTGFYLRRQLGAIQNYNCYQIETNQVVREINHSTSFQNIIKKIGKNLKGQLYYPIVTNDASSNENLSTSFHMTRKLNSQMFYQAENKQVRHCGNHPMIFIP